MSFADLIAKALDVNAANLALGNQQFRAEGATFVRNPGAPKIYDANHVCDITASTPSEIERLMAHVEREFDGFSHRRFDTDFRTPPAVIARLVFEGYERSDALVMLLEGDLAGTPPQHDIRAVASEADWEAYTSLQSVDWREYRERTNRPVEEDVGKMQMFSRRLKQPPVQYWIAYVDGRPAAYFNSWAGVDGVGQVEDLFTHPDFRRRGLATALIHHCVAECRGAGAGPVVIAADPTDTPKQMYAAMGFRPAAIATHYLKKLPPGS